MSAVTTPVVQRAQKEFAWLKRVQGFPFFLFFLCVGPPTTRLERVSQHFLSKSFASASFFFVTLWTSLWLNCCKNILFLPSSICSFFLNILLLAPFFVLLGQQQHRLKSIGVAAVGCLPPPLYTVIPTDDGSSFLSNVQRDKRREPQIRFGGYYYIQYVDSTRRLNCVTSLPPTINADVAAAAASTNISMFPQYNALHST